MVPHTHLDIGYTDYQGKVAETQARVLDQAAELIRQNPTFRFSMDASWNLEQLLATRSPEERDRMLSLIRADEVALPVQYCNLLTGYSSLETLCRSLYASRTLARLYHLPLDYANITDVPSYTNAYPSVLARAGIKYFVAAGNNWRAPYLFYGRWNEKSPFWWEGPDGKKVLFWYSRHYMQVQSLFGLPPVLPAIHDSLPVFLQAYTRPEYRPDAVLIYGTQVENTDLVSGTATFVHAWGDQYAYPALRYAAFADFFKYVDEKYGKDLPTIRGDGGPYWEDGVGSDAYYTAEDRTNQNRALSAEMLSSALHTLNPAVHPPKDLVDDIWRNILLFAEHTWASWNSVSQPDHAETVTQLEVKDHRPTAARLEIDDLMNRSLSQLADQIHVPAHTLVVFNSLNWSRDLLVETDLPEGSTVKDLTTGTDVLLEVLWAKQGFWHIRFLAQGVPSVGYKCYAIGSSPRAPVGTAATESLPGNVIENNYYRLTVDPASGAVVSIMDKELHRELVAPYSPYKFCQYLYVTGGDGDTRMIRASDSSPPATLTVHPAENGELLGATETPFGPSIRLRSRAPHTPTIETEVLILNTVKKIEFIVHVHKVPVVTKEGVYFAFPVATASPQFAYAIQTTWIDPAHDLLPGASLEWFNIQYWMAVRSDDLTVGIVPIDAPLASFGDINRGQWPPEFHPISSTLFSYVMNNYWDTNYRASQGGEFVFRYIVTSSRTYDPQALTRMGWSEMQPAELDYVMGQDKVGNPERPLPAEGAGFLEIAQANIVLVNWKMAEDGRGTILRLAEIAGRETNASLRLSRVTFHSANLCNAVEDDQEAVASEGNSLHLKFQPQELLTVRIQ